MHPISGLPLQLRQESEQFRRETDFGQYHVALLVFSVQFFATKCPLAHKIGAQTNRERQNLSKFGPIEQRCTIEQDEIFFWINLLLFQFCHSFNALQFILR